MKNFKKLFLMMFAFWGLNMNGFAQSSGSYTLTAGQNYTSNITLTGNVTYNVPDGTATISGVISGGYSITKAGGGTLMLTGVNAYTGSTTVSNGTLFITNELSLGGATSAVSVAAAGGLVFAPQGSSTLTFNRVISGSGNVYKQGTGTACLTAANTYSGNTYVTQGELHIGNGGSSGSINSSNPTVQEGATLVINRSDDLTFSRVITGAGNVAKAGAGELILSAVSNTYSGNTIVRAGTLRIKNQETLGTTSSPIVVEAGANILINTPPTIVPRDFYKSISGAGDVIVDVVRYSYDGGGYTTSVLLFTAENTYAGETVIKEGILRLGSAGSIENSVVRIAPNSMYAAKFEIYANKTIAGLSGNYSLPPSGWAGVDLRTYTLTINQATDREFRGHISGSGNIIKTGSGTLILIQNMGGTFPFNTTINGGTLQVASAGVFVNPVTVNSGGTLIFNVPYSNTLSRSISGTGIVEKTGEGTLNINSVNIHTGEMRIKEGTLAVGSSGSIDNSKVVLSGSGVFTIQGDKTIGGLSGESSANPAVNLGSNTLLINQSSSATFPGVISGTGGEIVKAGTGTLYLTGANTYTGATTILKGELRVNANSGLGNSTLAVPVSADATLAFENSAAMTFGRVISGAGNVQKYGAGTLTLSAANSYTGTTRISAGGITLNSTGTIAGSRLVMSGSGVFTIQGNKTIQGISGSSSAANAVALGGNTLTVNQTTNASFTGNISGTGGGITKTGAATLTLGGTNTHSGTTAISAGGVTLAGTLANSPVAMSGSGVLTLSGGNATIAGLSGTSTATGAIVLGSNTLTINQATNQTFSGVISGAGGVTKSGAGTLTLGGVNSYAGATTISAGGLTLNATGTIANSAVAMSGAGVFTPQGAKTIAGLSGTSTAVPAVALNSTLTVNQATNQTFSGVIGGTGSIVKAGNGTLTLGGANTYSGSTTVSAGRVTLNTAGTISTALLFSGSGTLEIQGNKTVQGIGGSSTANPAIVLGSSTLTINQATLGGFIGVISGTGGVAKSGSATLTLYSANTYSGATTVSAGTLVLSSTGAIASSALALSGSGKFEIQGNSAIGGLSGTSTATPAVAIGANTLTVNQASATTFSGVIGGAGGSVTKSGAGTLTLSGANSYTGATNVAAGGLTLSSTGTVAAPVVMSGTGVFAIQGNKTVAGLSGTAGSVALGANTLTVNQTANQTFAGVITGAGGVTKTGGGTWTLSGNSSAAGTFSHNAGTVTLNGGGWAGNYNKAAAATLTVTGNPTIGGNLTLNGGAINMNVTATPASKISVAGEVVASGTNTLNITATTLAAYDSHILMEASAGSFKNSVPYTLNLPGYDAMLTAASTQLILAQVPCTPVNAFPWTERFDEEEFPQHCWMVNQVSGAGNWTRSAAAPQYDGGYAHRAATSGKGQETWLITRPIAVPAGSYTLEFASYTGYPDYYMGGDYGAGQSKVWVSTTTSQKSAFTQLYTLQYETDVPTVEAWKKVEVDLTAYAGQTIYIAFVYTGDNEHSWRIDDVRVRASTVPTMFEGDGTPTVPYRIETVAQLALLATYVNANNATYNDKHYILVNNLDLNIAPYNTGTGWTPIGTFVSTTNNQPFKGVFDGNNKKISGVYINNPSVNNSGLFGLINDGAVKNLGVENVNINGNIGVGGVAGRVHESGVISNCYSTGNINGTACIGGVAGISFGSISNCYSTCNIIGINEIGGVVGTMNVEGSTLSNCYSTGDVSGDEMVGGVVGRTNEGENISNCYATGNVSGTYSVGGVAGLLGESGTMSNCYATGAVSGASAVGGVVGGIAYTSSLTNCAALNPSVKATDSDAGRVVGHNEGTTPTNNTAWDGILNNAGNTTWSNIGATNLDGAGISKEAVNMDGAIGSRFIAPVWSTENGKLPGLFGNTVTMPAHLIIEKVFDGDGTPTNPYQIKTVEELAQLANYVNNPGTLAMYNDKHYILMNDLNLDVAPHNTARGWRPIGTSTFRTFKGNFNGNNKVISGLMVKDPWANGVGLFGFVNGGTIRNLGVENVDIVGNFYTGVVAANLENNSVLSNCYSTGSVNGTTFVGGIIGNAANSTVSNCYSTCEVNGANYVGGILGYMLSSSVSNCYSTGEINSATGSGGVVGISAISTVSNCIALNPSVKVTGLGFGRVIGFDYFEGENVNIFTNNFAFNGLLNNDNSTTWSNIGATLIDGANMTAPTINTDGTLGNIFNASGNWTTANGKLPGLFGNTVEMPEHLLVSMESVADVTNVPTTATAHNPLLLTATVTPSTATNQTIIWSVVDAGATGATISGSNSFTATDEGMATVKATIKDGIYAGVDFEKEFYVVVSKANLTGAVSISGTATFGGTLTANTSGLALTPSIPLGALSYQWKMGETPIGDNSPTLTIDQYNIGATITVTVTAANGNGTVTSAATAAVSKATKTAPAAPTLLAAYVQGIDLNFMEDCQFSIDNGATWQPEISFEGLTPNTGYTFVARFAETATHTASPTGAAATFTTLKAELTGYVTITGEGAFGETLSVNTAELSLMPSGSLGTLSFQWKRGETPVGSNTATYTLTATDIESVISVTVTATNGSGEVTSYPVHIGKATQTPPAAPTLAEKTETSITLNPMPGCEFSIDGGETWQTDGYFDGLTSGYYFFIARKVETATQYASPESEMEMFATEGDFSADATLAKLTVWLQSGGESTEGVLSPAFDSEVYAYSIEVANGIASIIIAATATDPDATLSGDIDEQPLATGINIFTITVNAEDGTTQDYTITVTRATFVNITETPNNAAPKIIGYYNVLGQRLTREPERGVFIILYDDGRTEKVLRIGN